MKLIKITTFLFLITIINSQIAIAGGGHGHGHDEKHEEAEKGPHGGRLLKKDDFALEITIFEKGIPPEFRIYAFEDGEVVVLEKPELTITLSRLGGVKDKITFSQEKDYLKGVQEIYEPHSFDVEVNLKHEDENYHWHYESYEGRTEIGKEAMERSGIKTEIAGPASIPSELKLNGKVFASEHKIAHVIPRFPGVVRDGKKHIGDKVEKGEILAIIESNQSLQPYEVKSQIAGVVVAGHLIVGEYVPENQWVYIVADLSEVWVDFYASEKDAAKVKTGSHVSFNLENQKTAKGTVIYVTPFADEKTQKQAVRAAVPNVDGLLKPGMFISGVVTFNEKTVPLAVKTSALQTFRDWDVVFIRSGDLFEARPLELGFKGSEFTEVISGIKAGDEYVTEQSYLIKADILKSGASHDH